MAGEMDEALWWLVVFNVAAWTAVSGAHGLVPLCV